MAHQSDITRLFMSRRIEQRALLESLGSVGECGAYLSRLNAHQRYELYEWSLSKLANERANRWNRWVSWWRWLHWKSPFAPKRFLSLSLASQEIRDVSACAPSGVYGHRSRVTFKRTDGLSIVIRWHGPSTPFLTIRTATGQIFGRYIRNIRDIKFIGLAHYFHVIVYG